MKLAVVSASLSESSSANKLGKRIAGQVEELSSTGAEVSFIELRSLAHAIMDAMLTGFPSDALDKAFNEVLGADAVIAVTPAYNASYSGLFKSFFDVLPDQALSGKPVILAATGGTPRHSLMTEQAMRPMFVYMHAVVVSTAVYAATEDFGAHASDSDANGGASLGRRIDRASRELLTLVSLNSGVVGTAKSDQVSGTDDLGSNAGGASNTGAASSANAANQAGAASNAGAAHRTDEPDTSTQDATELFPDFVPFDQMTKSL